MNYINVKEVRVKLKPSLLRDAALAGWWMVGGWLPTVQDNISEPSSTAQQRKIFCSETSANNYEFTPHNIPQDRRSLLHSDKSLKFSKTNSTYSIYTAI